MISPAPCMADRGALRPNQPRMSLAKKTALLSQTGGKQLQRPCLSCHAAVVDRCRPAGQHSAGQSRHHQRLAAGLLGTAAGLSLLLPGSGMALEAAATTTLQQDQLAVGVPSLVAAEQQQADPSAPACYLVSSDLSAAPDLVTDADVEQASQLCQEGGNSLEATLVNGLGWVVEGAQEVTNFSENNFAAVGAPSSSMWLSNSPWCLMWDAYCNVLTTRPVATKLATGMVGTFLGDMVAQGMQGLLANNKRDTASSSSSTAQQGFDLDLARTARLVGFSTIVGTPILFVWFGVLDQYVFPADPTSPMAVFSKVALDQICMAPLMTTMFFTAMAIMEGCRSRDQVVSTVKSKLKPTLMANWMVWPLAHVINFALVPPSQRILYINVINIAWTAFISHMANSKNEGEAAPTKQQATATRSKQLQQASR